MEIESKPMILYAEDDENLAQVTKDHLEMNGYSVDLVADGKAAVASFGQGGHQLAVLDVMMPELDGFEVARQMKAVDDNLPIIFLTAKSLKEDKLTGLRLGADDYITKPYSIEELLLKIKNLLKRSAGARGQKANNNGVFEIGHYTFYQMEHTLAIGDSKKVLTNKEAEVIKILAREIGQVVKREDLLRPIWGNDDYFNGRSLDVFISKVRKLLQADDRIEVQNIHGIGYKLFVKE